MADHKTEVFDLKNATLEADGQSDAEDVSEFIEGLLFIEVTAAPGGTLPTLDLTVKSSEAGDEDFVALPGVTIAQITSAGKWVYQLSNFGKILRVDYTLGGTDPSFPTKIKFVGKT